MRKTIAPLMLMLSVSTQANDWSEAWHNRDKWIVATEAMLNQDNARRLVGKAGSGVLINGKEGNRPSLVTKRRDYCDVEVHVEFMVAKGSNSGVIFHGNYEIQILDSYGVEKPTAGHCGGVYPRAESKP
ncbi:MAG: family 16 glycoside hydrolase, partial [Planctomycetota bacterium]